MREGVNDAFQNTTFLDTTMTLTKAFLCLSSNEDINGDIKELWNSKLWFCHDRHFRTVFQCWVGMPNFSVPGASIKRGIWNYKKIRNWKCKPVSVILEIALKSFKRDWHWDLSYFMTISTNRGLIKPTLPPPPKYKDALKKFCIKQFLQRSSFLQA